MYIQEYELRPTSQVNSVHSSKGLDCLQNFMLNNIGGNNGGLDQVKSLKMFSNNIILNLV